MIFDDYLILPIKHRVDWELIRQRKHTQINIDNARKNKHRVDYDYKVKDKFIITNHTEYKYETPCKGPFLITQCLTNGTVNLQCDAIKTKYNIFCVKPYKYDTKVGDFNSKNMDDAVNI